MEALRQDLRYAWRSLRRAPLFTLTVLAILSLGTGVAAAMFGIVHHLHLSPYPVPGHERVVTVTDRVVSRGEGREALTVPRLIAFRAVKSLERLEGYRFDDAVLEQSDGAEGLVAARATPGLFRAIGVVPRLGRAFTDADGAPGAPAVAMVSERFARAHAASGAGRVGATLRVDGVPTLVIGVVPEGTELPVGADLWRPVTLAADAPRDERALYGVARLRDGASVAAARAELAGVGAEQARQFPDTDGDLAPELRPIAQGIQDEISPIFERLAAVATLLTLFVVAANLAGLQLARGAARRREWAVRAAIGASPGRLARQSMVESLLLAAVGGMVAWWVAQVTMAAVVASVPPTVTRYIPGWTAIGVDGTLLALVFGVSALTGLTFGWVPALHAGRTHAQAALRAGGAGAIGTHHHRVRATFVVAEVALSFVVLVAGVLMLAGFRRLGGNDLGFDPRGVLSLQVTLREPAYGDGPQRAAFHDRLVQQVATLPGVESAGTISRLPSSGSTAALGLVPEGGQWTEDRPLRASLRFVTPQALEVLRLPIVQGRGIAAGDGAAAPDVAVVNETFARRAWPGQDPLGRRITIPDGEEPRVATVVGVAHDVKRNWFERDIAAMAYLPDAQWGAATTSLVVRARDPLALAPAVRRVLTALDPRVPAQRLMTLERQLAESTSGVRLGASVMSWLGVFALLLAAIGLHALVAFQVAQRGQEFGVRMALGARREDILSLVMGEGARLVLAGLAFGAPLAVALGFVMTATLFGVIRPDAWTLAGVLLLLGVASAVALAAPAWRASRQDPMQALRSE
jgi:predicted permease